MRRTSRDIVKNSEAVLKAVRLLVSRKELPTMRKVCRYSGMSSTCTVQKHLQRLEAQGHVIGYRCDRGTVYMPASYETQKIAQTTPMGNRNGVPTESGILERLQEYVSPVRIDRSF